MNSVTIFQVAEPDETLENVKNRMDSRSLTLTQIVTGAEGEPVELTTAITNVSRRSLGREAAVSGQLRYQDKYETEDIEGASKTQVQTHKAEFAFIQNPIRLLVLKGNIESRRLAGKISRLLYNQNDDPIIACQIRPHDLDEFLAHHNPDLRACALGKLSIPDLSNVRLTGQNVEVDPGYGRYAKHGEKDSIRVYMADIDKTIGISRTASVQFYNKMELDEKVEFLRQYILDMCK